MSWFGETFGDSLNSLKGQITKITKEVLADDEGTNSERQESEGDLVKELQALCESKDLEIASLRDEFNKLHNQYKSQIEFLKRENKGKGSSETTCDIDNSKVDELKNELIELRQERDHLNSCLDELQSEHQTNLNQVISIRDKYKSELELLKKEFENIKLSEKTNQDSSNKTNSLNSKIKELELQLEKEREESAALLQKEKDNQNILKQELEKLSQDFQIINKDKFEVEKERKTVQEVNEDLRKKLAEKDNEIKEKEIQLKLQLNKEEELLTKCKNHTDVESKLSTLLKTKEEIKHKLKNLFQVLKIDEDISEGNVISQLNIIENKLQENYTELNKSWKESTNTLESEVKKLKEENKNIQNKLKISMENNVEMERKYQEEITFLKNSFSDMKTQEQEVINKSQTDDVKRLEQEIAQCMSQILIKNNEITDYSKSLSSLEQEIQTLKATSVISDKELTAVKEEKKQLEEEISNLRNSNLNISKEKIELEQKLKTMENEKMDLNSTNSELQAKTEQLEKEKAELFSTSEHMKELEVELNKAGMLKSETDKILTNLQNENFNLKQELENWKAQVIVKESNLSELMKANAYFQEEVNKLQAQNNEYMNSEKEVKKWKDASIDLQIQQEDLVARKEELENECFKLKIELETTIGAKNAEIEQLKQTNGNLLKSCNELHNKLENQTQAEHLSVIKENDFEKKCQEQSELILQLQEENSELKTRVQKFQEQMKLQMTQFQSQPVSKEEIQQHRRSKSEIDEPPLPQKSEELVLLKQAMLQEQAKYQLLHQQFQEISSREANARKEFERLKQHLIEVEDHYTEEAVENEKVINDLKSKLVAAEEQLHNSSTLYTSLKVRDNQHLESLQSQIRMVSAQRDDLQTKLSAAEDEVQKHKASLMSLQIVLEQFQQDKETEVEQVAMKYEKQLQLGNDRFRELEMEIQALKNQLAEAKNGLNAASRLGEQLEKKTQQVTELEENLKTVNTRIAELENSLATSNQANSGKIDKSLIKNLVVGYLLSANADRKSQVLKIMASVLDFDQDERNKMGVDATRSGWLSNILHPQGEGSSSSQSLSEAFIRFLENESKPQPQLKLLPEKLENNTPKSSRTSPKPSGRISELMLPTFNSPQENDSSIILKNVLKHS